MLASRTEYVRADAASRRISAVKKEKNALPAIAEESGRPEKVTQKRNWGIASSFRRMGASTGNAAKFVGGSILKIGKVRNLFHRRKDSADEKSDGGG